MEASFQSATDFDEALEEIDIFISLALDNQHDDKKRSLFLKSGILFLGTKIECFLEDVVEEYIYKLEQLQLTSEKLPEAIVLSAIHFHFSESTLSKIKQKKPTCKEELKKISHLLEDGTPISKIKIDTKFSYGKHGSSVIESLFERIGIDDVFNRCKVIVAEESMLSDDKQNIEIDIKSEVNSLTGIRNGIIHENKSPAISEETLKMYVGHFQMFVKNVAATLDSEYKKFVTASES